MRPLRVLGIAALVVALVAAGVWWQNVRDEPAPRAVVAATPDSVARGRYLVAIGDCIACHTMPGGAPFSGGRAIDTPFGTVYASNITPEPRTGIGAWSADDFYRALHNGRSRDGRLLYPAFPYPNFTHVTRDDADAMYAYLRTLAPVVRENTPNALRFPYDTGVALALWRAFFFRPGVLQSDPRADVRWNRGAYLVRGLGHCDACHANRNFFGAVSHSLDLGGGLIPMQDWYAPPLVGLGSRGPGDWDAAEIASLLRTGIAPRGTAMGPMAEVVYRSTQFLTAEDADAIAAYLKAQDRSARHPPAPSNDPDPAVAAMGAQLYDRQCGECHGSKGEGAFPAYPALAGNASVTQDSPVNAIHAVLNGGYAAATAANPRPFGMPPFFRTLSDRDIAAILTYVRNAWGNHAGAVTTQDVTRYR